MYSYYFNFKVVVESPPAADVLAIKDSFNSTISPETEATTEYEKPFRPNKKKARVLRIKMSETESEGNFWIRFTKL